MDAARGALPDDIDALKAVLLVERAKALEVAAELAVARAKASEDVALIAQQKLRIAKLERQVYGQRSERSARLVDQLALAFEELEAGATEDELTAEGKTDTGRCWIYLRDDKPFGGTGPPAAMFYYSRDRRGEHPQTHLAGYAGILQADAYDGYNKLYLPTRSPGPILEAACWVHARRRSMSLPGGGGGPAYWP